MLLSGGVFLYGGDAQAGRPASLTYGAVARIIVQKLEYKGDAVGDGERSAEFSYDGAERLTRSYTVLWETGVETVYTYNAAGQLETRRETVHNYDGETERIYTYECVKFDARGNWAERRVTVQKTAVRPVKGAEHEQSEIIRYPDAYQLERRKITYYG